MDGRDDGTFRNTGDVDSTPLGIRLDINGQNLSVPEEDGEDPDEAEEESEDSNDDRPLGHVLPRDSEGRRSDRDDLKVLQIVAPTDQRLTEGLCHLNGFCTHGRRQGNRISGFSHLSASSRSLETPFFGAVPPRVPDATANPEEQIVPTRDDELMRGGTEFVASSPIPDQAATGRRRIDLPK